MTWFDEATFSVWVATALLVVDFAIRVVAIIVVPRNRRPTSGMAWLLAIFFIPYVGIILFLVIGSRRLPRARRRKQDEINRLITEATTGSDRVSDMKDAPPWLPAMAAMGQNLGALPLTGGNRATLLTEYELTIRSMAEAVRNSRHYVHVQFYILAYDPTTRVFFEALRDAVERGVAVRVLLDHIASVRSPGYLRTRRKLDEIGVEWDLMLPVRPWRGQYQRPDLRNHRKILIVDGEVGFMGSQNLIDSSYNKRSNRRRGLSWKDLMVRVEGPIVSGLNAIFLGDWYTETNDSLANWVHEDPPVVAGPTLDCQAVPSGPGFAGENNLQMFLALLYNATERISITSPYFVPDESILYALKAATSRGVSVEIFVSEVGDQALVYHAQRSYYEDLLETGVRIFMYRPPYILHSKHFTIDNAVAVVGSSNMDMRSFSLNMEVSMMVHGESFVRALDEIVEGYRSNSRELTREEWRRHSIWSTMLDNLARLTSALQ
nr:cardiolipin synthase [Klugiella xanthotipulae]